MSLPQPIAKNNIYPRQRGVVIVVALFIVALVAAMSYAMLGQLERDTRRTSLLLHQVNAGFYARGAIAWAIDTLNHNIEQQKPNQLVDHFPLESPANDVEGYIISAKVEDMQGRFNLNNITQADEQENFKRLLRAVAPQLTDDAINEIVASTVDWITPNNSQNELSKYYRNLPHPYRAAHRPMVTVNELRLVKGMTMTTFEALRPFVTALPVMTKINVQTAAAPVLMLLTPTMTLETANAIIALRKEAPFVTVEHFLNLDLVKNHKVPADKITVLGHYFLVETLVSIEKQHIVLYTLLERTVKENKGQLQVLWQSKG